MWKVKESYNLQNEDGAATVGGSLSSLDKAHPGARLQPAPERKNFSKLQNRCDSLKQTEMAQRTTARETAKETYNLQNEDEEGWRTAGGPLSSLDKAPSPAS